MDLARGVGTGVVSEMQCKRLWVLYTLIATILVGQSAALPKLIRLGGLFDSEDEEQELAFRLAVEFFNRNKVMRPHPQLVAQVEKIANGDIYDATKKVCSLLEMGVAAIFGPQDHLTSLHVGSICDEVEVPHIETRWDYKIKRDDLSINLHPSPSVLSESYVTMVKEMGWQNFTLIYEGNYGITRLQNFLKEAEKNHWRMEIYNLEENVPYRKVFWQVKKDLQKLQEHNQKIVLDVERRNLFTVLKHAQQVGMMTEHQQYLITSMDLHTLDLSDFKYGNCNITGFRLVQESYSEYQHFVEAMARPPYNYQRGLTHGIRAKTALMFDAVRMFILALQELDAGKEVQKFPSISCFGGVLKGTDGTSLINYMKSSNMIGITGGITFNGQGIRSMFQVDLMNLQEEGLLKIGEMLPGKIINITKDLAFEMPLTERRYIVTTIVSKPYVMLRNSSTGLQGNDRFEGFCVDLIEELSNILQFKYEIRLVKDNEYGKEKRGRSGDWSGMIGEVKRGEAHMAVAGLSINSKREKAVDFTMPFMNTGISILYRKPTTKVTSLFSFLSPFSTEVWIYLMGAYFGVSFITFLVGRLTPYEWINPHPCRQDDIVVENIFHVRNSLWFNIGSLMQQGSDLIPSAFSTRTAASYWNFFTLIMVSSYTANLAAFLTVEKVVYPFHSAAELAKQKKIKYGCVNSGSTRSFFEDSNITTYKEMWKAMSSDSNNFVEDNDKGKQKVYQGNYAFLMESATIEYITERECSLTQIGGLLDSKGYGIATKKGERELSSWLSSGILKLQEQGVLHKLKSRWWKQKGGGKCTDKQSGRVRELTLGNVGGVFVVLIFGLGVSVLIAVLEFRWKSTQWENPNKDSFWIRLKKEVKFALSFDITTKPVPQLKKNRSGATSTADNSRSSSQGTNRSGS
ncbi:glutamate receptor ionotropic, kainate 2 [Nephila pilipes]|uniref:Glutamate receptor ionotropic, kainate 2 n=1 Tax=Nephila pilipes TaxID=299642 RepID=A0A8X6QCS6_NEPPI|nr:glutamate receptor ionotropic, kainate 2 [Nephila pilipes]